MKSSSHDKFQPTAYSITASSGGGSSGPSRDEIRIRPFMESDLTEVVTLLENLSESSRFQRFFYGCPKLSSSVVRSLGQADGLNHIAFVAVSGERIVGEARCIRLAAEPTSAELAIAIADAHHGHGIGCRLVHALACCAAHVGIQNFSADVLLENQRVVKTLRSYGATLAGSAGAVASFRIPVAAFASPT